MRMRFPDKFYVAWKRWAFYNDFRMGGRYVSYGPLKMVWFHRRKR